MLGERESQLAKTLIREFYGRTGNIAPRDIEKREFGFGDFERKIKFRHYSFKDEKSLKGYLYDNAPPFVSYSFSEYKDPAGRPMERKGWLGGDLTFDIDASDLNLKCRKTHSSSWVCGNCLEGAKAETVKLVEEFLIPDFGFSEKEISVNFSGNRGYHIHVHNDETFGLDGDARKGIIDYITCSNIELNAFFPTIGRRGVRLDGPKPTDYGWGGKLANGVISALNGGVSDLMDLGIDKKSAEMLVRKSAEVRLGITTGNWDKVNIPKKAEFWGNVLKKIAVRQSDAIDRNVSTDVYHIIRLPGTIHGDTGLSAKKIGSLKALDGFDPMKSAIAFSGNEIKINAKGVPKFEMGDATYGPYDNNRVSLPGYAAMYLVLKRLATLS